MTRSVVFDMAQDMTLQAIQVMRQGGIVIYPTDTAFGIGCRIDDYAAVDRLFYFAPAADFTGHAGISFFYGDGKFVLRFPF